MIRPVQRGVATRRIGLDAILGKALHRVVSPCLESHVHAPTQVSRDGGPVAIQARGDLHSPFASQHTALGDRSIDDRQFVDTTWQKEKPLVLRNQPSSIGNGSHLDRRLGAIEE